MIFWFPVDPSLADPGTTVVFRCKHATVAYDLFPCFSNHPIYHLPEPFCRECKSKMPTLALFGEVAEGADS
jgi:hypothetical protein